MGRSGSELHLEVRVPGRPTPFEVILDPEHEEWECDCPSKEAACSHVVAAALAVEQAGGELPQSTKVGAALRYLLEPATGGIAVARMLVRGENTEALAKSLMSLIAEGKGAAIATIEADLLADRVLSVRQGPVSGERLDRLLEALATARDVRWKGDPVTTSSEPVMPRAIVEDTTLGVRVKIQADPIVREVVAVGAVRTHDNVLRPIGAIDLSGTRLDKLPQTFDVPRQAFPELIGTTLPALAKRIDVEVRAQSLPQLGGREEPRIAFDVEQDGDVLRVFPTLVYGDPPRARVDGGRLVHLVGAIMVRDEDGERRLVHRLRDELNLAPGRRVELTGREAFAMQNGLASWLRTDARAANAASAVDLTAKIAIDGSRLDVALGARDGRSASIGAALRAWQAGVDLVPMPGGGWGRVPMAWFDAHGARVADLLAARGDDKVVPIYALPDLARLCAELDEPPPPELDRLRPLLDGFSGIPETAPGAGFHGELRPYQQRGLDWLAFCRRAGLGCVLADDMGLGKTIQALAAIGARPEERSAEGARQAKTGGQTLVVAPTSVLFNWLAELRKFRPDLVVATYHGSRRALDPAADVVVTSYPILRNDSDELAEPQWDTVILDESQTIKNPDSQVARAAYRLKARWRLTLSGTPIENRLDELWSQLHFTNPGLLGGRTDFQDRWAEPIVAGNAGAAARLRERIRPFVLRRMKAEVARELPPRTDAVMYVELDDNERVTYDAIRAATQREIVALLEAGGGVMAALEALLRLRQAACHTALLPGNVRGGAAPATSSKLERLREALEDAVADGHRALVFSQWTSLLDLIEPHLTDAGIKFTRLDGSTPSERRGDIVREFSAADGPHVMLLSLKAGGTGLNLTAADHVFLVDPWWNPAVEDQAADRAHRIGQDKPVMVYRMVARDTVEERILELQAKKRALADAALSEAGGAIGITRDDLLALLS
ncbi:MAG: DEAD/DEAH box helicase [Deltaproteobacteria bacterium]|nr:DEAD/DEAH box helicase [Deltaproteobacteria bacterium]MCW5806653.1 DEAD/DEAH box helicase [Deltaproteobacteria bacterium]